MMDVIIEQLKNLAEDFDQNEKRFLRRAAEHPGKHGSSDLIMWYMSEKNWLQIYF